MPKLNLEAKANWGPIRDAYLQETPCPTYLELSERFGVNKGLVGRIGLEENWPEMRLKRQQAALQAINAGQVIAEAITAERQIVDKAKQVTSTIMEAVNGVAQTLVSMSNDQANVRKVSDIANTLSFTISNLCNAMKALGVVGLPKALNDAGKSGNGQWDKQLLQQINVTVQGLTSAPAKVETETKSQGKEVVIETEPKTENAQVVDAETSS